MKILVMEDDPFIVEALKIHLNKEGYYNLNLTTSKSEALKSIQSDFPDIAILDIREPGDKEAGVNIAKHIKSIESIPIIYISSYPEDKNIAFKTLPDAYILKPNYIGVVNAIELAIFKFYKKDTSNVNENTIFIRDYIFVKKKGTYFKVKKSDILYVKANHGYIDIHTNSNDKYLMSSTMKKFAEQLNDSLFLKVHKSYYINFRQVSAFNSKTVIIGENELPVSKPGYEVLLNLSNRIYT